MQRLHFMHDIYFRIKAGSQVYITIKVGLERSTDWPELVHIVEGESAVTSSTMRPIPSRSMPLFLRLAIKQRAAL